MKINTWLVAILVGFMSQWAYASEDAQTQLQRYLNTMQQFQAQFDQQVVDEQGDVIQESSGRMALARPNQFHWQVTEPDEELMVADGNALWLYNPFLEQVTIMDFQKALQQSPFMLLMSDNAAAWDQYTISQISNGFSIKPNVPQLIAEIRIERNGNAISRLILLDSQGKTSVFTLSQFDANSPLPNTLFHFTVPQGVEIDDQRE